MLGLSSSSSSITSLTSLLLVICWIDGNECLSGFLFEDNKSDKRYVPENGEINYKIATYPHQISSCFVLYVNYNRYSSIVPIWDFRHDFEPGYYNEFLFGKPDMLRIYGHTDFIFDSTSTKNIRLKWMAICYSIDYDNGTMSMFLNGEKLPQKSRKAMALPADSSSLPLVVRLGKYFFDDTPLLGKILDFNMWDRVLTEEEMASYSQCGEQEYTATPPGNLINQDTVWNITGTLIKKIELSSDQIDCKSRTLLIPVKYRTIEDAMGVCEELGERGGFLKPFTSYADWVKFYNLYARNPAIQKYCYHGGRYIVWLPYQGWTDVNDVETSAEVNVTYYGSDQPLLMSEAWRKNNPKNSKKPYCVVARIQYSPNESWVDQDCDIRESVYGWDRAPCSACTISNLVTKNIEFELRGLCDRTGFDTAYMVMNEEGTGLISYIGTKHTIIRYDQNLYQWNMTVANNPDIQAVSYSEVSSLVIGKHSWQITGDYACNSKPQTLILSLSSCDANEFTCAGGVCIDLMSRCDNINDCDDRSDEADCSRVSIDPTYQRFIVPPPSHLTEDNQTEVHVSLTLNTIMDISEVGGYFQVQFDLILKWFESRLRFKNLKDDMNLNSFLPTENHEVWVPELIFVNTQEKPTTITDDRTSIKVEKNGEFKLSPSSENENIQYFEGAQNPLEMKRFYNQRFLCDYGMQWYPFDVQICKLKFEMKPSYSTFTNMVVDQITYEGEEFLTQYQVREVRMISVLNSKKTQEIHVEITLGRQLLGVILNVIIPTFVLNMISYSTNFYKDSYFETVIAINLTTMLVMVTLFVSVSESLPATSYIKMIDAWLIFNLIIPFVLIMIHTYMDTLRDPDLVQTSTTYTNISQVTARTSSEDNDLESIPMKATSITPTSQGSSKWGNIQKIEPENIRKNQKRLRIARHLAVYFIPIFSLLFVIIFFGAGILHSSLNY